MKLLKIIFVIISLGTFFELSSITLDDCISAAKQKNSSIQQSRFSIDIANVNLKLTRSLYLPNISLSMSTSRTSQVIFSSELVPEGYAFPTRTTNYYTMQVSLLESILLPNEFINRLKRAKAVLSSSIESYNQVESEVVYLVKISYLEVLKSKALLDALVVALERTEEDQERTESLFEMGLSSEKDLVSIKAQVLQNKINVKQAELALRKAIEELSRVTFIETDRLKDFEPVNEIPEVFSFDSFFNSIRENNPELKSIKESLNAEKLDIDISKSGYYPVLSLSGRYEWQDTELPGVSRPFTDLDSWMLIFSVRFPVFDGLITKYNIDQEKIGYAIKKEELKLKEKEIYSDAKKAYLQYRYGMENLDLYSEKLSQIRKSFELTREAYSLGIVSLAELELQRTSLSSAEADSIRAHYDVLSAIAYMEKIANKKLY